MKSDSAIRNSQSAIRNNCPACGAESEREFSKYCRVCGKFLAEDYQPLDTLRAANRLHGKAIVFEKKQIAKAENLFELSENTRAETARASLVYSLVPYIGIIFIPLTFFIAGTALVASPKYGGKKIALTSIGLSFVVLAVQIFLWWLLYIIPTLGR